jgi:hypothetical protein
MRPFLLFFQVSSLPFNSNMLEDSRYGMNPIGQMIRELEFYKRWFPLAVTAVLVLMALLTCYIFYVIGGILFISNKEHFKLISIIICF